MKQEGSQLESYDNSEKQLIRNKSDMVKKILNRGRVKQQLPLATNSHQRPGSKISHESFKKVEEIQVPEVARKKKKSSKSPEGRGSRSGSAGKISRSGKKAHASFRKIIKKGAIQQVEIKNNSTNKKKRSHSNQKSKSKSKSRER